jgi:arylsulfatase A-like enzyme
MRVARPLIPLLILTLSLGACHRAPPLVARPASPRAPFLVTIVIDQMAAWIAAEHWPALPPNGGFARLAREGLTVRQLRYAHSDNDTAPGHSALYTGAVPRTSGIFANEVLGENGRGKSIVADDKTQVVAPGQTSDRHGASLAALKVETVADALRAVWPAARIYSLSLKDRGAVFGGGKHPDLALWLDLELDTFVTSTAFAPELPAWAAPLADRAAVQRARAAAWEPLDRAWLAAHAETAEDQAGEGDYEGLGIAFPHNARSARAERATPEGDALLFALARAAAADGAASGAPVLLALSLSSHDYVLHVYGPQSWEAWDELRRLDAGLGELLAALDHLVGSENYAVMLTGDHGSNPLPEVEASSAARWCAGGAAAPDRWQRPCGHGRRLSTHELAAALEEVATRVLGHAPKAGADRGPWIAGVVEPYVYLAPRAQALPAAKRARFLREASTLVAARFDVAALVDVHAAPATCPPLGDDSVDALVCRSIRPDGPADLYVLPRPGTFFDPELPAGHGTSHGSPYLYDRAVPLLVRAPGRVQSGSTREDPISYAAFAQTAAALLGVRPPADAAPSPILVTTSR